MTDYYEDPPPEVPKPPSHGRLVAAGVVGALVLGAGMGLWARPAPQHQLVQAKSMAPEDAPRPALQIIVDDDPAPIGPLLEVLPGDTVAANEALPPLPPPAPIPEPIAPRRPAAGLMKVDDIVTAEPLLVPAVKVEERPKPKAAPKPAPEPKVVKAPEKPKVQTAKVEPKPKPEKLKVAEAKPKKDDKAKAAKTAKLAEIEKAKAAKLAKAENVATAKAEKVAQAEKLAKAEKAKAAKLAQAEAKKQKVAKAQAESRRMATLVKAVRTAPKKLKAEVAKKKIELAQAKPAKKPQVQKPKVEKPKVEKASVKPPVVAKAKPPAPKKLVIPRGEGPMRVARNDACASADPGETAVCSDRRLGARDRQLQQAYRNAEAAGVPATALRRQQDRWLQARAAAAREAPWAVEDVYEARISELNDLTRDARGN